MAIKRDAKETPDYIPVRSPASLVLHIYFDVAFIRWAIIQFS